MPGSGEPGLLREWLGSWSAARKVGGAIGPSAGSGSPSFGRSGPGLAAASLCLINVGFAWRFLPESRDMTEVHLVKPRASRTALAQVVAHPGQPANRLIWIYAVALGAFAGLMAILALFLPAPFGVGYCRLRLSYTSLRVLPCAPPRRPLPLLLPPSASFLRICPLSPLCPRPARSTSFPSPHRSLPSRLASPIPPWHSPILLPCSRRRAANRPSRRVRSTRRANAWKI